MISSIPSPWRNELKSNLKKNTREILLDKIKETKTPNKVLYNLYQQKFDATVNKAELRWNNTFENIEWKDVYSNIFLSNIDSKLRTFQYKYLHRIIPTNEYLYKI